MSPPIYRPDGVEVSEIVLPDGSTASEVIGPDGNVVFEAGPDIPDSGGTHQYNATAGSGSTLTDSIASLDGTINGASWQTGGKGAGDAYLSYDGSNDYVDLGLSSQSELNHILEGNGTLGAWVKLPDTNNNYNVAGGGNYGSGNSFNLLQNKGSFLINMTTSGTSSEVSSSVSTPTNEWLFVAFTLDGSDVTIYEAVSSNYSVSNNGSNPISATTTNDLDGNVTIGKEESRWYFPGNIDIVFTDSVAQSQSTLQSFVDDTKGLYQ